MIPNKRTPFDVSGEQKKIPINAINKERNQSMKSINEINKQRNIISNNEY